jgi:flagellar capping protein FliD
MSTISARNRYAGLISGLDTEEMVKAMSANTKNRLNAKKQKLQILQWKQEGYRDVISKIRGFQSSYLDTLSSTSIKLNAVMKKFAATSSSDKVTATASSSALACKYTISKATAAKAAEVTSSSAAATGSIALDFSNNVSGKTYTVKVTLDNGSRNVTYTAGATAAESQANFLSAANNAFNDVKAADQSFKFKDGTSTLIFADTADTSNRSITSDGILHSFGVGASKEATGLVNDTSSKVTADSKLKNIDFIQPLQSDDGNFQIKINGVTFQFSENTTVSDMMNKINSSSAGVKMSYSSVTQTFKVETSTTGLASSLDISQSRGNLLNALFNMDDSTIGSSNAASGIPTYSVYGTVSSAAINYQIANGFANPADAQYNLDLTLSDGTTKNINFDLSSLTAKTQSTDAFGNKLYVMHTSSGDVTITAKVQGDGTTAYTDSSNNTLFFEDTDGKFYKAKLESGVAVIDRDNPYTLSDGTTVMTKLSDLNIFEKCDSTYTDTEISTLLKNQISAAFGGEENVPDNLSVTYSAGKIVISSDKKVTINNNDFGITSGINNETLVKYTSTSQVIVNNPSDSEKAEMKFTLNGTDITITAADGSKGITIGQLVNSGLFTFNSSTGELVANGNISSTNTTAENFINSIFGVTDGTISGASDANKLATINGTNATMTLSANDGTAVNLTSATNIFVMDGTTINISNLGEFNPTSSNDYITIDVKRDTSAIKDTVVKFVDAYNTLLKALNTTVQTARPTYNKKFYDPLTEEEQEDMEQDEIDKWNEKAKTGLLYQDNSISKFISSFKTAMTTSSGGMDLGSMGITVSKTYSDYGQLIIDESKLNAAIENHGDEVADFFTNADTGLAAKLETTINEAVSTKKDNYGYLTLIAGVENTSSDKKNMLYTQIDSLQTIISNLETKYANEQERYWNQFTQLEKYMNSMSSQSSLFNSSSN